MITSTRQPKAPAHLSDSSRRWFDSIAATFRLEAHHVELLTQAATALDRITEARQILADDGIIIHDQHGTRAHPAVKVEKDSSILFARLVRELRLGDDDLPGEYSRPPRLR
jgi:phage terminase small subunit